MNWAPLDICGAFLVENDCFRDFRGAFHSSWDEGGAEVPPFSFRPSGLHHSHNLKAGTLRGLHFQKPPRTQAKIVTCVRGSLFDVVVDLRADSATQWKWTSVELDETTPRSLYIPHGCAHGFLTREDHTTVAYLIEGDYAPAALGTVRWDDPRFGIEWPTREVILSERDRTAPDYHE